MAGVDSPQAGHDGPRSGAVLLRLAPRGTSGQEAERARCTLIEVMRHNSGNAPDRVLIPVLTFMMRWEIASTRRLPATVTVGTWPGPALTIGSFAEYWGESERTAYRLQSRFRALFPGHHDPGSVVRLCQGWNRSLGWRGLAAVTVHVFR